MKRIVALLLTLICVFALAACNGGGEEGDPLDEFTTAISASDPKSATVSTVVTSSVFGVELKGEYNVTYLEDGTATVEYEYEQLREIDENTSADDELEYTVNGTATIAADGTVTGDVSAQVAAVAGIRLGLDSEKLTYSVSSGVLSATVKAQDTSSVLGVAIASDVTVTVSVANGSVSALTLAYDTTGGTAEIVCLYNY